MRDYSLFVVDILSQEQYKLKLENESLKVMITKLISGEYNQKRLIDEFQSLLKKDRMESETST